MSSSRYELKETDVLVIGGGMAGLWAAIRARELVPRVILVDKARVGRSGASVFTHTTMGPVPDEAFEDWRREAVELSGYIVDQELVGIIHRVNTERLRDMVKWGVALERDEKGDLKLEAVRGAKVRRSVLWNGRQAMDTMRRVVESKGVELVERVMVTDLLTSDGEHPTKGQIVGAVGLRTRTGEMVAFRCKAAVVATGGTSPKLRSFYVDNGTGEGLAMAFRVGAELGNMELAFNPCFSTWARSFVTGGQQQFLMYGAKIVNRLGERFMAKYFPPEVANPEYEGNAEFGELCRAMAVEILEGRGPVYFDMRGWPPENIEKMHRILPATMVAFNKAGIDLTHDLVETTPIVNLYSFTGEAAVRIDQHGESNIRGLFAAGVSALTGVGINPQASCAAIGYIAGENAARLASDTRHGVLDSVQIESLRQTLFQPLHREDGISPDSLYLKANNVVVPYEISFFKHADRIRATLKVIRRLAQEELPRVKAADIHELVKANEARSFLIMLEVMFASALERKESRISHYREEYPYRDNENWLRWVLARIDSRGAIQFRTLPVILDPVRLNEALRVPARVQYTWRKGITRDPFG